MALAADLSLGRRRKAADAAPKLARYGSVDTFLSASALYRLQWLHLARE